MKKELKLIKEQNNNFTKTIEDNKSDLIQLQNQVNEKTEKINSLQEEKNHIYMSMLDKLSVFEIMDIMNIEELSTNQTDDFSQKLFKKFFEEISGQWYSEEYLELICNKDFFGNYIYIYNFYNIEEENEYGYSIWNGWDGVGFELNKIKRTDDNCYTLFRDDNNIEFTIYIEDDKIIKIVINGEDEPDKSDVLYNIHMKIEDYINDKVLKGTYKDDNGDIYRFTDNKKAVWPNRTFFYEPHCYLSDWDCNPIRIVNENTKLETGELLGYLFIDDKLHIYEIKIGAPMGYKSGDEPILILEKIE